MNRFSLNALELRNGLHEQGRIIFALIMRDIQVRFGQKRIGFAWAIVEPAIHVGVLFGMRSVIGGVAPMHIPLLLWLVSGIIPMLMFRGIFQKVTASVRSGRDILILPRIQVMDLVWARALLDLGIYTILLVVMLVFYATLVEPIEIVNPLMVMACLFLLMMLGISGGMVGMVVVSIFPSTQPLVNAVLRLLYISSGVIFTPARLPPELHPYLALNPLLHVFETLHAAFFSSYIPLPAAQDFGYVAIWIMGMFVLGTLLRNRFMRLLLES